MIGQYLPQTNESATVPKTFQFSELNKADGGPIGDVGVGRAKDNGGPSMMRTCPKPGLVSMTMCGTLVADMCWAVVSGAV